MKRLLILLLFICYGISNAADVPLFRANSKELGYDAIDIYPLNTYYSFVGNVLGMTGKHANWANATLRGFNEYASASVPIVYSYGGAQSGIPSADSTSLNHGNYDFKTNGVAFWEGGSNHALKKSMYYSSAPAFFGSCAWPTFGPDLSPLTKTLPAKARYEGDTSCNGGGGPPPPQGLAGKGH